LENEIAKIAALIHLQQPVLSGVCQQDCTLGESGEAGLVKACSEARAAWASAVFTGGKENLESYFTYQVNALTELLERRDDPLSKDGIDQLTGLIGHICTYFPGYIAVGTKAPEVWARYRIASLKGVKEHVFALLSAPGIDGELLHCLDTALTPYFTEGWCARMNFGTLDYLELLLTELRRVLVQAVLADKNRELTDCLLRLNFNCLGFFSYLVAYFNIRTAAMLPENIVELMTKEAAMIRPNSHHKRLYYDFLLPPVAMMYKDWLLEESQVIAAKIRMESPTCSILAKIGVNLSVPQLACLTRVLIEVDFFRDLGITEILKVIPLHFSAKRQDAISPGSFSVKYYSSEQKAAAKIKDMLTKMIAWLNKHYFPVMVAASVIIGAR
jgi:hypothetical protein